MRATRRTSGLTVVAVLAAFGFRGPAQDAAPSRAVESRQVNPVGERPEHQRLSKAAFPAILREFGDWSPSMLRYFDAVQTRLGAAADATFGDAAADHGVRRLAEENRISLFGGPMLGCLGPRHASVWVRTLRPARVEVVVTVAGSPKRFGPVESTLDSDLTAVVPVTGLVPGAVHRYRVFIDGTSAAIPEQASIETWPDDGRLTGTRIVFGSCFHRWGLGNALQANTIRARRPAALLFCGDTAAQDKGRHRGLARGDYFMRDSFPPWRALAAVLPVYATWDDHDYLDNDLAGLPAGYLPEDQERTWEVFRRSWVNPAYGFGDGRRGVFFRTRIGLCDVIMLDTRFFREKGSFLGAEQMQWLEKQLLDCKGPFIILTSGTMWSDYVTNGKDSWGVWDPQGRERLFSFIEKNRIPGVLLVSGDRHGARGFRIPRPSGFAFYEFEPASLGGRSGPTVTSPEWKDVQLFGYSAIHAFGELTIDAAPADPLATFRLIRENGEVLEEVVLSRSRLTPPPPADVRPGW
jgi:alkaline phosphatase D